MAKANQKITLSPSRNIPFDKLVLSQANVRESRPASSIEELAADIAHRGLVASLNVRPVLDEDGRRPACTGCRPAAVASGRSSCSW